MEFHSSIECHVHWNQADESAPSLICWIDGAEDWQAEVTVFTPFDMQEVGMACVVGY